METKDIKPLEGFDWEAFENDGVSAADKAAQKAAYEGALNNVTTTRWWTAPSLPSTTAR